MTHRPENCKPCQINIIKPKQLIQTITQPTSDKPKLMPPNIGGVA